MRKVIGAESAKRRSLAVPGDMSQEEGEGEKKGKRTLERKCQLNFQIYLTLLKKYKNSSKGIKNGGVGNNYRIEIFFLTSSSVSVLRRAS